MLVVHTALVLNLFVQTLTVFVQTLPVYYRVEQILLQSLDRSLDYTDSDKDEVITALLKHYLYSTKLQ